MARLITVLLLISSLVYALVNVKPLRRWTEELDYRHLNGKVFEVLGRGQGSEKGDIALYKAYASSMDYGWMDTFKQTDRWVAHGLGGDGRDANMIPAYKEAKSAGFTFFEVDIVLESGELVCAHDLSDTTATGACTFDWLISRAREDNVWFILDVKSDFKTTYSELNKRLKNTDVGKQFIPQIYAFNQLELIDVNLMSAPIFTAYRRNMSLKYMTYLAGELGLPGITLPPHLTAKDIDSSGLFIFTHGVNDINAIDQLKRTGVSGFYIKTSTLLSMH